MAKCLFCKFDNVYTEFEKHRSHTTLSAIDRLFGRCFEVFKAIENKTTLPETRVCEKHTQEDEVGRFMARFWRLFDELKEGVRLPVIRTR